MVNVNAGFGVIVVVVGSSGVTVPGSFDTTGVSEWLPGSDPLTVAWLDTLPASTSAWVTTCVAAAVAVAFGASVAIIASDGVVNVAFGSVIVRLLSVTLPVFFTVIS